MFPGPVVFALDAEQLFGELGSGHCQCHGRVSLFAVPRYRRSKDRAKTAGICKVERDGPYGGEAPSRPILMRLTSKLPSAPLPVATAVNGAPGVIAPVSAIS